MNREREMIRLTPDATSRTASRPGSQRVDTAVVVENFRRPFRRDALRPGTAEHCSARISSLENGIRRFVSKWCWIKLACRLVFLGSATIPVFSSAAEMKLPSGVVITSESKTHVHALVSNLRADKFPELEQIHALFTVYFKGQGATDEKLKVLSQLRFTNLACVVFTDCPLVTDTGIEYLSRISTLNSLGLRQMSVTDAACDTMITKMRLVGVNMPNCTNVTVNGLLKMVQAETMESLGFSVGQMKQDDLLRIIRSAGSKLNRLDIEMVESAERRLDLPALRQAAEDKGIKLYAVRNNRVRKL